MQLFFAFHNTTFRIVQFSLFFNFKLNSSKNTFFIADALS
jgi:hypothetical protein